MVGVGDVVAGGTVVVGGAVVVVVAGAVVPGAVVPADEVLLKDPVGAAALAGIGAATTDVVDAEGFR